MINAQPGGASSPKAKIAPRKFRRAGPRASFGQPPPTQRRPPSSLPHSFRQKTLPSSPPLRVLPLRRTTALAPLRVLPLRRETAPRFLRTTVPNPAPGLRASFLNPPGGKALPPSSGFIPSAGKTTPPPARFLRATAPNPAPLPGLPPSILPAEEFLGRGKHPRSALPSGHRPQSCAAPRAYFLNPPGRKNRPPSSPSGSYPSAGKTPRPALPSDNRPQPRARLRASLPAAAPSAL